MPPRSPDASFLQRGYCHDSRCVYRRGGHLRRSPSAARQVQRCPVAAARSARRPPRPAVRPWLGGHSRTPSRSTDHARGTSRRLRMIRPSIRCPSLARLSCTCPSACSSLSGGPCAGRRRIHSVWIVPERTRCSARWRHSRRSVGPARPGASSARADDLRLRLVADLEQVGHRVHAPSGGQTAVAVHLDVPAGDRAIMTHQYDHHLGDATGVESMGSLFEFSDDLALSPKRRSNSWMTSLAWTCTRCIPMHRCRPGTEDDVARVVRVMSNRRGSATFPVEPGGSVQGEHLTLSSVTCREFDVLHREPRDRGDFAAPDQRRISTTAEDINSGRSRSSCRWSGCSNRALIAMLVQVHRGVPRRRPRGPRSPDRIPCRKVFAVDHGADAACR